MNNEKGRMVPAGSCAICGKTLEEIGGLRILTSAFKELNLPDQSPGEQIPWSCQKCAGKVCESCGEPLRNPMGCNILYDDGLTYYFAMLPVDPGCINPNCERFRKKE